MGDLIYFPRRPARRLDPGCRIRVLAGSYQGREGRVMMVDHDRGWAQVAIGGVIIGGHTDHMEVLPEQPGGAA